MDHDTRLIDLYKKRHYDALGVIFRKGMLVASGVCCAAGIAVTAATGQITPMFLYIAALVCMALVLPLMHAGLISGDMRCTIPTLFFCFVYTPVNWFVFNGLLGSTPYLSRCIHHGYTAAEYQKMAQYPSGIVHRFVAGAHSGRSDPVCSIGQT